MNVTSLYRGNTVNTVLRPHPVWINAVGLLRLFQRFPTQRSVPIDRLNLCTVADPLRLKRDRPSMRIAASISPVFFRKFCSPICSRPKHYEIPDSDVFTAKTQQLFRQQWNHIVSQYRLLMNSNYRWQLYSQIIVIDYINCDKLVIHGLPSPLYPPLTSFHFIKVERYCR